MSRKLLSLGTLAAVFTLVLGTVEVQAEHCRNQYRSRSCCQSGNNSRSIFSMFHHCNTGARQQVYYTSQQPLSYGCQPPVRQNCQPVYTRSTVCCNPQPACRVVQTACQDGATTYAESKIQSPPPSPPLDNAPPPAPAPGRASSPDFAPTPTPSDAPDNAPAPDSATAPTPAPGR